MCVNDIFYYRTIGTSYLRINSANWGTVNPIQSPTVQDYSTLVPKNTYNNNAGISWLTITPGTYVYTSNTGANPTPCLLPPITFAQNQPVNMNALKCEPRFLEDSGNIVRLAPLTAPNKITVFLPMIMVGATTQLNAAIAQWNTVLPSTVQFELVTTSCGFGPACITVSALPQPDCGSYFREYSLLSGEITGNLALRVRSDWNTLTPEGLRRTFIHELGHFLGLDDSNAAACGISDAAMQDQFNCAAPVMENVTINDSLPVVNTVYGGKTKSTCGW